VNTRIHIVNVSKELIATTMAASSTSGAVARVQPDAADAPRLDVWEAEGGAAAPPASGPIKSPT
jgi:hypothetical protein